MFTHKDIEKEHNQDIKIRTKRLYNKPQTFNTFQYQKGSNSNSQNPPLHPSYETHSASPTKPFRPQNPSQSMQNSQKFDKEDILNQYVDLQIKASQAKQNTHNPINGSAAKHHNPTNNFRRINPDKISQETWIKMNKLQQQFNSEKKVFPDTYYAKKSQQSSTKPSSRQFRSVSLQDNGWQTLQQQQQQKQSEQRYQTSQKNDDYEGYNSTQTSNKLPSVNTAEKYYSNTHRNTENPEENQTYRSRFELQQQQQQQQLQQNQVQEDLIQQQQQLLKLQKMKQQQKELDLQEQMYIQMLKEKEAQKKQEEEQEALYQQQLLLKEEQEKQQQKEQEEAYYKQLLKEQQEQEKKEQQQKEKDQQEQKLKQNLQLNNEYLKMQHQQKAQQNIINNFKTEINTQQKKLSQSPLKNKSVTFSITNNNNNSNQNLLRDGKLELLKAQEYQQFQLQQYFDQSKQKKDASLNFSGIHKLGTQNSESKLDKYGFDQAEFEKEFEQQRKFEKEQEQKKKHLKKEDPYKQMEAVFLQQQALQKTQKKQQKPKKTVLLTDSNHNFIQKAQTHLANLKTRNQQSYLQEELISLPGGAVGVAQNEGLGKAFGESLRFLSSQFEIYEIYVYQFEDSPFVSGQIKEKLELLNNEKEREKEYLAFCLQNIWQLQKQIKGSEFSHIKIKGFFVDKAGNTQEIHFQ